MSLTTDGRRTAQTDSLTYRQIFTVWMPLAFSWMLMLIETPFINGVLARLSEPELAIAAFGLIMSISVVVESPVVPLLTTSTALSKSPQNFHIIRRFTLIMTGISVGLHFLVSWTPIYDLVVVPLINMPSELVEPVRAGLRIMVPWSGFVAWRRFNQGILIRNGYSRFVGKGTILRLLALSTSALTLGFLTDLPGTVVGGIAANLGTLSEAIYATIVTRPVIREKFESKTVQESETQEPDLCYRDLIKFHTPLFLSSLIFFLTRPLISAGLARTPNPTQSLAAWPVLLGLLSIVRAPVIAYPAVVVSLAERKDSRIKLRNFGLLVGVGAAMIFALVAFTPLKMIYFRTLMGVSDELTRIAISGAAFALILPIVGSYTAFVRGILTNKKFTIALTLSTLASIVSMALTFVIGISQNFPGVPLGAAATVVSYIAEMIVLYFALRWLQKKEKVFATENEPA